MVTLFVAALMAKILSPSVLSTRAATAWIRTGRRQAATFLAGQGVLPLRLQRPHLQATTRVVVPPLQFRRRTRRQAACQAGAPSDLVELGAQASSSPAPRVVFSPLVLGRSLGCTRRLV